MTRPTVAALESVADRIEHATALDKPADVLAGWVRKLIPHGRVEDVASGSPLGHPAHPLLVALPIGSWASANLLDLTGGDARTTRRLIGLGIVFAVPAAATGANDWATTSGGERRMGFVHAALNWTAIGLYTASWLARGRGRRIKGKALALAGTGVLSASGWLGGHLTYALGVGVDTTAFQTLPAQWTDVAAESDVTAGKLLLAEADGIPVLLVRAGNAITAMADRCTHRGGPLNEGEIRNGCVVCPWHHSEFAIADGSLVHGPATRPQPTAEVRVIDGRVQVRRADEPSSLRAYSVGP
jgi:nitrite reductase/ring-hydroxylating ferredoxin subunit/uncharacterized membrane protein